MADSGKGNGRLFVTIAVAAAVIGAAWAGFNSNYGFGTKADLSDLEVEVGRHDERIKTVEANIGEIKQDVKTILRQTARDTP